MAWSEWAEQMHTGLAILDGRLRLRWLNSAFAELLAVGPRSALGQSLPRVLGDAATVLRIRRAQRYRRILQLRALRLPLPGGAERRVDLFVQPLSNGGLGLEMHDLVEPVISGGVSLSASLRGFAHEVRNPLAGLRGAAQLLQRRVQEDDLRELAELVIAEADRLSTLADRLLQNETHGQRVDRVNIHRVLEHLQRLLAAQPPPQPSIRHDYDPSLPDVEGDPDRLLQILLNLARNAIDAGAQRLTLRTRVERGVRLAEGALRSALRVDVMDDGRGVPPALGESLFLPLASGRSDGSGLGLALCREIAREHGGELSYRSRAGETVFSLYLPWPRRLADGKRF